MARLHNWDQLYDTYTRSATGPFMAIGVDPGYLYDMASVYGTSIYSIHTRHDLDALRPPHDTVVFYYINQTPPRWNLLLYVRPDGTILSVRRALLRCAYCLMAYASHVQERCLYEPTTYAKLVDHETPPLVIP